MLIKTNQLHYASVLQQQQLAKQVRQARLKVLRYQLNPHFLFNNMNVMISLIELDPKKAVAFGHNLSNVYRYYLKNQTEDFVSLKEEMDLLVAIKENDELISIFVKSIDTSRNRNK